MGERYRLDELASVPRGRRRPARPLRRLLPHVGAGAVISGLVALLLLAAPFALAHGTVTFSAPFTGFTQAGSNSTAAYGCAAFHVRTVPTWTPSKGIYRLSTSATAPKCSITNFAETYSSIELTSPVFPAPRTGSGSVYVDLSAAFSANATLHLGSVSNGSIVFGEAEVYLVAGIYVYDVTHHTPSLFGNATTSFVNQVFTSSGSYSITTGWTNSTMYVNGSFTGHHLYEVQLVITAEVYVESYGGGSTAGAAVNLAGADGLKVSSIVAS